MKIDFVFGAVIQIELIVVKLVLFVRFTGVVLPSAVLYWCSTLRPTSVYVYLQH